MKHIVKVSETPISVHMQRIYQRLKREQNVRFSTLFQKVERREIFIGIFLAVLELVRHEYAYVSQQKTFGEIYIILKPVENPESFRTEARQRRAVY